MKSKLFSHLHSDVINDAEKLRNLGVRSPLRGENYATAWNEVEKKEVWFKTETAFNRWRNNQQSIKGWRIKIINNINKNI